ncbi:MAG TPA: hypothetical protein DCE78_09495 [Bacteroidetes bacterium]|nr:hypothetical protein [Bacteroidota bacterium]
MHIFKLFIYGTLRSDGPEFHLLSGTDATMSKAKINAKLYLRAEDNIPYITVPGKYILGRGSHDYTKDAALIGKLTVPEDYSVEPNAPMVEGELFELPGYKQIMQVVDLYEDFSPGYESEYDRVLYPVKREDSDTYELAWVYVIANNHAEPEDKQIESGIYLQD